MASFTAEVKIVIANEAVPKNIQRLGEWLDNLADTYPSLEAEEALGMLNEIVNGLAVAYDDEST